MMKTFFVSRHNGAQEWARHKGIAIDRWETHLDLQAVEHGDTVIGILPTTLAAEVCARGAVFLALAVSLPPALRGVELSAAQLFSLGAALKQYHIIEVARNNGESVATDIVKNID